MLLGEPQRTQFDFHFQVAGFRVRVHPLFWLAGIVLGSAARDGAGILIFVAAFFFSILVHELGHSFAMRYFGQSSHIVLYMMGGLAIPDSSPMDGAYGVNYRSPRNWIIICAAGPGAGFIIAILLLVMIPLLGGNVVLEPRDFPFFWSVDSFGEYHHLHRLVSYLLQINILWGLINLLPVFPLDGGQIARELYNIRDPYTATTKSLWLSVITAGIMVALAIVFREWYMGVLFASLGLGSFLNLRQIYGGGRGGERGW